MGRCNKAGRTCAVSGAREGGLDDFPRSQPGQPPPSYQEWRG